MPDSTRIRILLERLALLTRADDRRAGSLQPTHLALIRYLHRANRYSNTPGAAALYLGQTKGTVSQSIGVLERRGLLRKSPDPMDGRVVRLALTARGRRLAGDPPAGTDAALATLPVAEVEQAALALETLIRAMQRATGGRSFGQCETCRWLLPEATGQRCGLTKDALEEEETRQVCVEHAWPG